MAVFSPHRFYILWVIYLLSAPSGTLQRYNPAASSTLAPSQEDLCALEIWCLMFLFIHPGHSNPLSQATLVSHSANAAWIESSTVEELELTDTAEKAATVPQWK